MTLLDLAFPMLLAARVVWPPPSSAELARLDERTRRDIGLPPRTGLPHERLGGWR